MPEITLAQTDAEILECFETLRLLRPQIQRESFLARVREQQQLGYHLAALRSRGKVRSVAGFRILYQFAYGRVLYVDDLVTAEDGRSQGHGKAMLDWLVDYAKRLDLEALELDSGVQRYEAHRFYFRERMHISAYHFRLALKP